MRFKPLPRTSSEWDHAFLNGVMIAALMLLTLQLWARLALSGWMRQQVEEMVGPFPWCLALLLIPCSVAAAIRRQRLLSSIAATIAALLVILALLPTLLHEGIIN